MKGKRREAADRAAKIIRRLIDFKEFKRCCDASEVELTQGFEMLGTNDRPCFYLDNNSTVLAVAHLDSVQDSDHFKHTIVGDETFVFSPVLDDRAGVYIILDLLPKMGINVDVLLTTGEETGSSTASEFYTSKKYMWGVEFDRGGHDVVTYDFDNKAWEARIKEAGFKVGSGTFSDISRLEEIGCSFMNIGVGSYDGHAKRAYLIIEEMIDNLAKFFVFYELHRQRHFPHVYVENKWNKWDGIYGYGRTGYTYKSKTGSLVEVYSNKGRLPNWSSTEPRVPDEDEYPSIWDEDDIASNWEAQDVRWMEGL